MKRAYRWHRRNPSVRLMTVMLVPMLFISMSSLSYALWNCSLTTVVSLKGSGNSPEDIEIVYWHVDSTNMYDVNCNDEVFGDELKIENIVNPTTGQVDGLKILADPIFPSWHLILLVGIKNVGTVPVNLAYAIYYWDETISDWVPTDEAGLETLFSIIYEDGFYLDKELTTPMPPGYSVSVDEIVYKKEHVTMDENAPQSLQGKNFTFRIEIIATKGGI